MRRVVAAALVITSACGPKRPPPSFAPDPGLVGQIREAFGTYVDIFPIDCSDTMQHVYRLYNNRPDANHRYTVSPAIRDQMMANGWILEAFDHSLAQYEWAMASAMTPTSS